MTVLAFLAGSFFGFLLAAILTGGDDDDDQGK